MVDMLGGALLLSYLMAGTYFFKFWKRTGDRLFIHFAVAFWLFVLNQLATSIPDVAKETDGYEYLLRVIGFIVIIVGIVDKNLGASRNGTRTG
jgi:hypothetical protein